MAKAINSNALSNDEKLRLKDRLDEELALLNGQSAKRTIREEDIRVYDFRQPDKFSKQQLSTLTMLFDNFAREATTTLTSIIQTNCEVEVANVEQKPFQEVLKNFDEITVLNLVTMRPLEGQAILEISLDGVQAILYRVFGGEGGQNVKSKDLTTIERGVVRRITNALLNVLTTCFQNIDNFEMNLDRMETNPQFLTQIPAMEICVKVSFNMQIDHAKSTNMINVILPFLMLESILPKLTNSSVWLAKVPNRTNKDSIQTKIEENLHASDVNFKAEIGKTRLTLEDISALEVGDIIILDTRIDDNLQCFVENRKIGTASAGTYRDKAAVIIDEIFD